MRPMPTKESNYGALEWVELQEGREHEWTRRSMGDL